MGQKTDMIGYGFEVVGHISPTVRDVQNQDDDQGTHVPNNEEEVSVPDGDVPDADTPSVVPVQEKHVRGCSRDKGRGEGKSRDESDFPVTVSKRFDCDHDWKIIGIVYGEALDDAVRWNVGSFQICVWLDDPIEEVDILYKQPALICYKGWQETPKEVGGR